MSVLLWLLPSLAATVLAMLWVSWAGRERRDEVPHEEQMRRLGDAVGTPSVDGAVVRDRDRAPQPGSVQGGVVIRRPRPEVVAVTDPELALPGEAAHPEAARHPDAGSAPARGDDGERRAS
ncbi:hypothetical protein [Nocardioides sp. R-C-SC26]|uniref:hypothetical protein n=1 Tax=Nocardioides sp. R-C-SC26 TaxID=2870414 RepID=UPI001E41340E|nr:hypothetical protein [Nocardioides sp. R-C-SC26]